MRPQSAAQAIAEATSLLVNDHDVADLLARLLRDCTSFMPVLGAGIFVRDVNGNLELVCTTSHAAAQLEIYEEIYQTGPSIEVVADGAALSVVGQVALLERWPLVGTLFAGAGIASVYTFPLLWKGRAIGGLNLFSAVAQELSTEDTLLAQSLTDLATIALARSGVATDEELHERIQAVLGRRVVVEQAKGVVAVLDGVDLGTAFERLVARAEERGTTLAQVAEEVIASAHRRT